VWSAATAGFLSGTACCACTVFGASQAKNTKLHNRIRWLIKKLAPQIP
jgi:hypothetical protein